MESIGIASVLAKISTTVDPGTAAILSYGVKFLTRKGTVSMLQVRKYTRGPRQSVTGADPRGKQSYSLRESGIVKLCDISNHRIIDVKAAMIYAFKDFKSENWLKVYH